MAKMGPHASCALAVFLRARLAELIACGTTQAGMAARAGCLDQDMITALKQGTIKLALDQVAGRARRLEADSRRLFMLALKQQGRKTTVQEINEILGVIAAPNESERIEALREASDHADPFITKRGRVAVRAGREATAQELEAPHPGLRPTSSVMPIQARRPDRPSRVVARTIAVAHSTRRLPSWHGARGRA